MPLCGLQLRPPKHMQRDKLVETRRVVEWRDSGDAIRIVPCAARHIAEEEPQKEGLQEPLAPPPPKDVDDT